MKRVAENNKSLGCPALCVSCLLQSSATDIIITNNALRPQGSVLFARFFEGDASFAERTSNIPKDPMKRVQEASSGLVDVPIIMETMRDAIKRSVIRAR